jgi:subtilisin-like proprotein convertase family protein
MNHIGKEYGFLPDARSWKIVVGLPFLIIIFSSLSSQASPQISAAQLPVSSITPIPLISNLTGEPEPILATPSVLPQQKVAEDYTDPDVKEINTISPHLTISHTLYITPTLTATITQTLTPTVTASPTITPAPAYLPLVHNQFPDVPPTPVSLTNLLICDDLAGPLPIPDNDPSGVASTINIMDNRFVVDLDIYVRIDHSWVGDLQARLEHSESGVSARLFDRPRYPATIYGCSGTNLVSILDDQAAQPVEEKCNTTVIPTIAGSFQPDQPLSIFNGEALAGTWELVATDQSYRDTGSLRGWCLDVTVAEVMPEPTPPPTPSNIPSEARIYNISGVNQALPLDCESRSAVDWSAYFGVSIGELEFFNRLPTSGNPELGFVGDVYGAWGQIPPNPYGVHAPPVAALLREYGLEAYAQRILSWDDVRAEVASGRPVIAWVIGSSNGILPARPIYYHAQDGPFTVVSPYQHTAIVIGYTPTQVVLLDGASIYTRSTTQFLDSWSVLRFMAITFTPVRSLED